MGSHIVDGEFQSDKYPTTPPGKVPLSVNDANAQDLLWEYAQRRRAIDPEFSKDLEECLRFCGYDPRRVVFYCGRGKANHHGKRGRALRLTARVVELGRDSWMMKHGRRTLGVRLLVYGRSGAYIYADAILKFRRSPWRPPSRYAPRKEMT